MLWNETQWERHAFKLPKFLSPLVRDLGRRERRVGATLYVEGLLLPGQRKSIEPMAERLGVDAQKLQQFITDSPWKEAVLWKAIRTVAMDHLEPLQAWIVDESGWLKQGTHSVGVAHQYCGAVGKSANCQVNVQVAITDGQVAVPVGGRLYLPRRWTDDRARCEAAGVPDTVAFATKPQIALELIQEALADGVARAPVLADNDYGINGEFRDGLRRQGMEFFLQIDPAQLTGRAQPVALEKKRTRWQVPEGTPAAPTLKELFARHSVRWHRCSWKTAQGTLAHTRLAWMKVYLPGALERGADQLEDVWLVVDWPEDASEAYHYYLAHLHREPTVARCLKLSRSRWNIEQYFQRAQDDLGLDHFEGRSWRGFHHHLVMTVLAYLFVVIVFLEAQKKVFWCDVGASIETDAAVAAEVNRLLLLLRQRV